MLIGLNNSNEQVFVISFLKSKIFFSCFILVLFPFFYIKTGFHFDRAVAPIISIIISEVADLSPSLSITHKGTLIGPIIDRGRRNHFNPISRAISRVKRYYYNTSLLLPDCPHKRKKWTPLKVGIIDDFVFYILQGRHFFTILRISKYL